MTPTVGGEPAQGRRQLQDRLAEPAARISQASMASRATPRTRIQRQGRLVTTRSTPALRAVWLNWRLNYERIITLISLTKSRGLHNIA